MGNIEIQPLTTSSRIDLTIFCGQKGQNNKDGRMERPPSQNYVWSDAKCVIYECCCDCLSSSGSTAMTSVMSAPSLPPSLPDRYPFSNAFLQHSEKVIQPCMWFVEEPSQFSVGQTAQSLTCSIMEKPHTGLDECFENPTLVLESKKLCLKK